MYDGLADVSRGARLASDIRGVGTAVEEDRAAVVSIMIPTIRRNEANKDAAVVENGSISYFP